MLISINAATRRVDRNPLMPSRIPIGPLLKGCGKCALGIIGSVAAIGICASFCAIIGLGKAANAEYDQCSTESLELETPESKTTPPKTVTFEY